MYHIITVQSNTFYHCSLRALAEILLVVCRLTWSCDGWSPLAGDMVAAFPVLKLQRRHVSWTETEPAAAGTTIESQTSDIAHEFHNFLLNKRNKEEDKVYSNSQTVVLCNCLVKSFFFWRTQFALPGSAELENILALKAVPTSDASSFACSWAQKLCHTVQKPTDALKQRMPKQDSWGQRLCSFQ